MNVFDKYVISNIKMIKTQVFAIIAATLLLGILSRFDTGVTGGVIPVLMIINIVIATQVYISYKKLFYDSIYGKSAMLYNQFPLTKEEVVIGKMLALGIAAVIMQMFFLLMLKIMSDNAINIIMNEENSIMAVSGMVSGILEMVTSTLYEGSVIFGAIVMYNSVPKIKRTHMKLLGAIVFYLIMNFVKTRLTSFVTGSFNDNGLVAGAVVIGYEILVILIMMYVTVKKLKESYEI